MFFVTLFLNLYRIIFDFIGIVLVFKKTASLLVVTRALANDIYGGGGLLEKVLSQEMFICFL